MSSKANIEITIDQRDEQIAARRQTDGSWLVREFDAETKQCISAFTIPAELARAIAELEKAQ